MQPKISVIVPVYKAEECLHRCVDSILSQTFTDFELLLINDGSPDNSGTICDEYAQNDSRIRVLHKENGGVSSARNHGLDNAKGKWITFVDADDYIEDGFLEISNSIEEDLLIQNYKVRGHLNYEVGFSESTIQPTQIQKFINTNIDNLWLRTPWSKFFKRETIYKNKIRFAEGIKIGEDTIFVLDYLYYTKSVRYMASASYIYEDKGDYANKYKLSAEKAVETFRLFIERYNRLNAESTTFIHFAFMFYWSLLSPKNYKSIKIWKKDKVVKHIYHTNNRHFGMKWRIKYKFYILYIIYTKIFKQE